MQRLTEENISTLINEAIETLGIEEIYNLTLNNFDSEKVEQTQDGLTREEIAYNFAICGFIAGIRYTLENITLEEKGDSESE